MTTMMSFPEEFNNEDPQALVQELVKALERDPKDRSFIIISAVDIDDTLRRLLQDFMVEDKNKVKELLEGDRSLGSFSSRIQAAYCLGLISQDEYHDLNIIRKIRNQFAHRPPALTFEDDPIKSWTSSLRLPKKCAPDDKSSRGLLVAAYSLLMYCFEERFSQVWKAQRTALPELTLPRELKSLSAEA